MKHLMAYMENCSLNNIQSMQLLTGKFSDLLSLFFRKDLNAIIGEYPEQHCKICSYADENVKIPIYEHVLKIMNRGLTNQVNNVIKDEFVDLVVNSFISDKK